MRHNPRRAITEFQETVWDYYHQHGRDLPWRQLEAGGKSDPSVRPDHAATDRTGLHARKAERADR